jgi:predicted acyltransferase
MQTPPGDPPAADNAEHEKMSCGKQRLLSLDVFRGFTVLCMVLVDKPGSWDDLYWPLEHSQWLGWTPTDLVFPFFVFIVGASISFSIPRRVDDEGPRKYLFPQSVHWRIARRTLTLIVLGVALNESAKFAEYLFGHTDSLDLSAWRATGVLQRIAAVYLAVSILAIHVPLRGQFVLAISVLTGYAALLTLLPNPADRDGNLSPEGNVVRLVDLAHIGADHLYTRGVTEKTDPEGVLSMLPSVVTGLFGYWTGLFLKRPGANAVHSAALLAGAGVVGTTLGLLWGEWLPISKKLWTSSFVVFTAGMAMVALAGCVLTYDGFRWRFGSKALQAVGANAIFVYVASWLFEVLLDSVVLGDATAKEHLYSALFTSWITAPKLASLAWAVVTVAFWWAVALLMSQHNWRFVV